MDLLIERFAHLPLFTACTTDDLRSLEGNARLTSVKPGAALEHEGRDAILVVTGRADILRGGTLVETVGPGTVVGAREVITGATSSEVIVAVTTMEVLTLSPRGLWTLLGCPGVAWKMLRSKYDEDDGR